WFRLEREVIDAVMARSGDFPEPSAFETLLASGGESSWRVTDYWIGAHWEQGSVFATLVIRGEDLLSSAPDGQPPNFGAAAAALGLMEGREWVRWARADAITPR